MTSSFDSRFPEAAPDHAAPGAAVLMPLRFVHVGDLHITDAGLQNHVDLGRIVDEINANAGDAIDFVVLPGDNADDGTSAQFRTIADEMARLARPWHALPGDHDFKPKSLDNFYQGLDIRRLPYATETSGCRCIFLDIVSAGAGGPDFRLRPSHMVWLEQQLVGAQRAGKPVVVFMHAYPADLQDGAAELAALFDRSPVVLVDTGHTHYNELVNDGRTIYAATRSTGQIEEGHAGFAFAAVDGGAVSWRFKPLGSSWPFVMITAPADRRLVIDSQLPPGNHAEVRASVWGHTPIAETVVRIDDGDWHPMRDAGGGVFAAAVTAPDRPHQLSVRVTDHAGHTDIDTIEITPAPAQSARRPTGSDAGSIGAWPERHLLATQLGPNKNGRKW